MNLSKRHKRPTGYVSLYPNVDGYFLKKCTYSFCSQPSVFVTKEIWETLEELNKMYYSQTSSLKRRWKNMTMRYPFPILSSFIFSKKSPFVHLKNENLENSYLFRMYCNGFNAGYRYFFYDKTTFMTSPSAIKNQKEAFLKSSRVRALDFEPNSCTTDIKIFSEYCYDLGQKAAGDYCEARWPLKDVKLEEKASFTQLLRLDADSSKDEKYLKEYIETCLSYVKGNGRSAAKRAAVFFSFLQKNGNVKMYYPGDISAALYDRKVLLKLWNELQLTVKADSFVTEVHRYYSDKDNGYNVKAKDAEQLEYLLVSKKLK